MGKYYFKDTLKTLTEKKLEEILELYPIEVKGIRKEFSDVLYADLKKLEAGKNLQTVIANDVYDSDFWEKVQEVRGIIEKVEIIEGKLRLKRDLEMRGNILIDLSVSHCPHAPEVIDRIYEHGREFANYIIRGKKGKEMIKKLEKEYKARKLMVEEGLEEDLISSLIDIIQNYNLPLNSGYIFGYSGECNYIGYEKE